MNCYQHSHANQSLFVMNLEFHSTCLAFWSPAIRTGRPPPRQADRSDETSGRKGDSETAWIFTGLLANMTWIAVAFRCSRSWTGTAW
jgi:hypothetical protein